MERRILIYGGTGLSGSVSAFVEELSYTFLKNTNLTLVTGGFLSSDKTKNGTVSTDVSILKGARRFVSECEKVQIKDRLEVWLPDPELDRNNENVKRFGLTEIDEGDVTIFERKSAQARRLSMVKGVDAIITIKGKKNTALILELAFTLKKPVLPLCFTGGDSKVYWKENKDQVFESFNIENDLADAIEKTKAQYPLTTTENQLIEKIVEKTKGAIKRRCLILMPYSIDGATEFYENVVKKLAIAKGYHPIRIDEETNSGLIFSIFQERIKDTDCVLADITEVNPNVMYELGYIRAQNNINPILFSRKKETDIEKKLAFYLRDQKVDYFVEDTDNDHIDFIKRIGQHLEDRK